MASEKQLNAQKLGKCKILLKGCWNECTKTIYNLDIPLFIIQWLDLDCPLFYSVLEKHKKYSICSSFKQRALNLTGNGTWESDNRTKTVII